ncbi:hypothetical protein BASA81_001500 [Batrachochytrium salamandrivorans]|nr:hypothetical protein BASA81_001500 [Batrachochytrium salamandrivorans]
MTNASARLQPAPLEVMSESERQFIHRAAKQSDVRMDGRRTLEWRQLELEVSTLNNSRSLAKVKLAGGTQVFCLVSCELAEPYPDRPNEGGFQLQIDYMHSAGSGFAGDGLVERAIQKAVDVESLCIVPGRKAWFVKCQLVVVDDCGSVSDALSVAACSALMHFRRPDVTVVGEEVTVHNVRERIPVPLTVQYLPLCFSVAVLASVEEEKLCTLVDPTHREEIVAWESAGVFQVVLNTHHEVCGLVEAGAYFGAEEMMELIEHLMLARTARGDIMQRVLDANPFEVL